MNKPHTCAVMHPQPHKHEMLRRHEDGLSELISSNAARHVKSVPIFNNHHFEPNNPEYWDQRLDVVGREATPANSDTIAMLATTAFGKSFTVYQAEVAKQRELLSNIIAALNDGEEIVGIYTHERTDDIIIANAALMWGLIDYAREHKIAQNNFTNLLIISKFITGLQVKLGADELYIPPLLANLGELRYSLPSSATVRASKIPSDIREIYNQGVIETTKPPTEHGQLFNVAVNSTVNRYQGRKFGKNRHPARFVAAPIRNGTVERLRGKRVIPISAHVNSSQPDIRFGAISAPIEGRADLEKNMRKMCQDLGRMSQMKTIYISNQDEYDSMFGR